MISRSNAVPGAPLPPRCWVFAAALQVKALSQLPGYSMRASPGCMAGSAGAPSRPSSVSNAVLRRCSSDGAVDLAFNVSCHRQVRRASPHHGGEEFSSCRALCRGHRDGRRFDVAAGDTFVLFLRIACMSSARKAASLPFWHRSTIDAAVGGEIAPYRPFAAAYPDMSWRPRGCR